MVKLSEDLLLKLQDLKNLMSLDSVDEAIIYAVEFALLASKEALPQLRGGAQSVSSKLEG